MYQSGDRVIYGSSGICLVEKVGVPDFETFEREKLYYFLRAEEDGSRIYAPVDTSMPIRALSSHEEADALLRALPTLPVQVPSSRDRKVITAHYQQLMQQHTLEALLITVKSVYAHSKSTPGRMSALEEGVLKKAEAQLYSELAAALSITAEAARNRVLSLIRNKKETE